MAHDILIVDDEPDIRSLIDGILSDEGYETRQAHNSDAALAHFRARRPALVILDVWLQNSRLDGLAWDLGNPDDDVLELARYAVALAERLQQVLSVPVLVARNEITTSASIGITFSSLRYTQPEEVLRDADIAMYKAKACGRNTVMPFTNETAPEHA